MLYIIIRLAIFALILLAAILIQRKFLKNRKRITYIAISMVSMIIGIIIIVLPFENLFYTFKTPEEAFRYSKIGEIYHIENGDNSCMVYYINRTGGITVEPFVESENGYKLGNFPIPMSIVDSAFTSNGVHCDITRVSGTEDHYVDCVCFVPTGESTEFSDSFGSEFTCLASAFAEGDSEFVKAYAYIGKLDDGYEVYLNGEQVYPAE